MKRTRRRLIGHRFSPGWLFRKLIIEELNMQFYRPQNPVPLTRNSFFLVLYLILAGMIVISPVGYFLAVAVPPPGPPLLVGWLNGRVLRFALARWKIASPLFAVLCAIGMGITSYVGLHYGLYWRFLGEVREEIVQATDITDYAQTNQMTEDFLVDQTGSGGFGGYLQLMAQTGVSALRISPTFGNITVTGVGVWVFWLSELVIIVLVSAFMAKRSASYPFCYTCHDWYRYEHLGSTTTQKQGDLLALLQSADFASVGNLMIPDNTSNPSIELYLGKCQCDEVNMKTNILKVSQAGLNAFGNVTLKDITFGVVAPDTARELLSGMPNENH